MSDAKKAERRMKEKKRFWTTGTDIIVIPDDGRRRFSRPANNLHIPVIHGRYEFLTIDNGQGLEVTRLRRGKPVETARHIFLTFIDGSILVELHADDVVGYYSDLLVNPDRIRVSVYVLKDWKNRTVGVKLVRE